MQPMHARDAGRRTEHAQTNDVVDGWRVRRRTARLAMTDDDEVEDVAALQARRLQARGQRLQAELRRLQRKFLPAVLGRVKTPSDRCDCQLRFSRRSAESICGRVSMMTDGVHTYQ